MSGVIWSTEEDAALLRLAITVKLNNDLPDWKRIGQLLKRTSHGARHHYAEIRPVSQIAISPYPKYDAPLVMEGDCLVLPDPEFPFHHAEFLNRCLDLADKWGIKQCNIAGDTVHFDSLSGWEANWINPAAESGLSEEHRDLLEAVVLTLQPSKRDELLTIMDQIAEPVKEGAPSISQEMEIARKSLKVIGEMFDRVDLVIGNHDGRLLRALNSATFAEDFKKFLDATDPKWRIAPFYFSYVMSEGVPYLIEHPKGAAKYTASQLADKYQCHVLMAHSHRMSMNPSKSGQWMGWQIGCCVDERRLSYAAQRHNTQDAHALGAAIIRGGYVTVLTEQWTDWARLLGGEQS